MSLAKAFCLNEGNITISTSYRSVLLLVLRVVYTLLYSTFSGISLLLYGHCESSLCTQLTHWCLLSNWIGIFPLLLLAPRVDITPNNQSLTTHYSGNPNTGPSKVRSSYRYRHL
jgi:hypothetical protein